MYAVLNDKKELFWLKVPGAYGEFHSISIFETRKDAQLAIKALHNDSLHMVKCNVAVTMPRPKDR